MATASSRDREPFAVGGAARLLLDALVRHPKLGSP